MNKLAYYQGYMSKEAGLKKLLSTIAKSKGAKATGTALKNYGKDLAEWGPAVFAFPGGGILTPVSPFIGRAIQKNPKLYNKIIQTTHNPKVVDWARFAGRYM
jgi:hypothetical protein